MNLSFRPARWPHSFLFWVLGVGTLAIAALSGHWAAARAQTPAAISMNATIGLDGFCKYGQWMPVRVLLENTGADEEGRVEALLTSNTNEQRYAQELSLPAVSRKEVTLYVYVSSNLRQITVSFLTEDAAPAQVTQSIHCIQPDAYLVGVLAANPSAFNILATLSTGGIRPNIAQLQLADLSGRPHGLNMLDMLVISDVDTGLLSEAQRQALGDWVTQGGKLVVTGGPGWQKTAAGLTELLPLRPTGSLTLPALDELEAFSPGSGPLLGDTVIATGEPDEQARVLAAQAGAPLILSKDLGFGEAIYFAFDPSLPPLRNWPGIEDLYQTVFSTPADFPAWINGFSSWYDASTALANIPGLGLPSFWLICGFLGAYIAALGPLNYAVLRRLKRRELAWVTIPILVILFSAAAFILGLATRGGRPIVNQLAIVQVWPDRDRAYVNSLIGVFSPSRSTYDIQLGAGFFTQPLEFNSLGGEQDWRFLQTETGSLVEGMRVDVGGIEGVAIAGWTDAPDLSSDLSYTMNAANALVEGTIQNNTPWTIRDAVLLGPGFSQKVDDLSPGAQEALRFQISASAIGAQKSSNVPFNPFPYDNTIQDLLGVTYVTNSDDHELVRRFHLAQAALAGGGRGGGLYLAGWVEASPLEVTLKGKGFRTEPLSLYIFALSPKLEAEAQGAITLPPALFVWSPMDTNASVKDIRPYENRFPLGVFSFRFQLNQAIPYERVQALTLHYKSYGRTGNAGLNLYLWDFTQSTWTRLPVTNWGDHLIENPASYVGFGGEIRVQIENPSSNSVEVERIDFSLVVEN